jgi:hypothetical protein
VVRAASPVIEDRVETPEGKAAEKELRKASLTRAEQFFTWLEDGASPEERAALEAVVPGPVVFILGRVLGRPYHRNVAPAWR